jgi:hypothetical protein
MVKKKKPIPVAKKQQVEQKKAAVVNPQVKPQVFSTPSSVKTKASDTKAVDFVFGRMNYILMIAGIALIALGFILMIGGGSDDPKVFNPEIFNTTRLTISPILILLGFAVEFFAILKKPRE